MAKEKKQKKKGGGIGQTFKENKVLFICLIAFIIVALIISFRLNGGVVRHETIKEMMKDAVLHEENKIWLFGIFQVNPGLISAMITSCVLIVIAVLCRIFIIPKFSIDHPGKGQIILETWVGFFSNLAKKNSPHCHHLIGAYVFTAGSYIFISTMMELIGLQGVTTEGYSITLPAALSDINGAIMLGVLSYFVILAGGIIKNGGRGAGSVLKDFSLMISMSFRLFGAMLSGVLVTELVYYTIMLSIALPVIVAVLFTCIHALVQTYVLCMLTTFFFGEATHPHEKKPKKKKQKKNKNIEEITEAADAAGTDAIAETNAMQEVG